MKLQRVVVLALLALAAVHAGLFFSVVEDAYISYRYAENLASGQGIVFNPGERVEGYTNFLWVILLSLCRALGLPIPRSSQILGLLLTLGNVLLAADLGKRVSPGARWGGLPAALFVAASPCVAAWAGGGMEAPLFSFLLLLTADLWVVEAGSGRFPWKWPLAACLAGMARPDGVLHFLVALALWVLNPQRRAEPIGRRVFRPLLVFLALGLPYFLWRSFYFGALLPNTFHTKSALGAMALRHGLAYLQWFLVFCGGAVEAAGALAAIRSRNPGVTLLLVQSFASTLYVTLIGGESYPYTRFLVPVAVLLAPAAEFGFRRAWSGLTRRVGAAQHLSGSLAGTLMVLLAGAGSVASFTGQEHRNFWFNDEVNRYRRPIAEFLRDHMPPDTLLALNPAGLIPYVSGLPALDQLGLTDAHIARRGRFVANPVLFGHNRYDSAYVLSRRPDILILGAATILIPDRSQTDLRRPGRATFDAVSPAVVQDFHGFPGDDATWNDPLFRRLYTPTIVPLEDGFFYYFALDRSAAAIEERMASGQATPEEHAAMAGILRSKGEVGLALAEARQAEAMDSSFSGFRSELEKEQSSVEQEAIRSAAASQEAHRVLLLMRSHLDYADPAAAEQDLLEGLRRIPGDGALLFNLGVLYEQTSRPDQALEAYRKLVAAHPDHVDAWNNLGSLHARRGDFKEARECWEHAVALNPASPAAENLRRLAAMGR